MSAILHAYAICMENTFCFTFQATYLTRYPLFQELSDTENFAITIVERVAFTIMIIINATLTIMSTTCVMIVHVLNISIHNTNGFLRFHFRKFVLVNSWIFNHYLRWSGNLY